MHFHLHPTLLLLGCTTARALSITQPPAILQPANLTSTTLNATPPTNDWECRSGGSTSTPRPSLGACALALAQLPKSNAEGVFHGAGAGDDAYKLPHEVTVGSCTLRIAIAEGWDWNVQGDWSEVATEAMGLYQGCREAVVDQWFLGAQTSAGQRGKISITFQASEG